MIIGIMGAMPDEVDQLCARLENVTDISRDGAMQGTNRGLYRELSQAYHLELIASGGVSSLEDVLALMAYLGAICCSGIDLVLDLLDFDKRITGADWVITGEGRSDAQTLMGKVPEGVLRRCHAQGIPVWLLSGSIIDPDHALTAAFDRVSSINDGDTRPLSELLLPSVARVNMTRAIVVN